MEYKELNYIMKRVETQLLFPYEGHLVSGKDIDRETLIGWQRTAFNKLFNELRFLTKNSESTN